MKRTRMETIKKETAAKQSLVEVGGDGFEPPKLEAADLQSAPFGHSGNHPCFWLEKRLVGVDGFEPPTLCL